jgi:L-asparaginase II
MKKSQLAGGTTLPDNPVLARRTRGDAVESQHRGAWVVVNSLGEILDGDGAKRERVFARSSTKSMQALPLIESGAAKRFGLTDVELALAISSHNAEACHTGPIAALLARLGLSVADLGCGPSAPSDPEARRALFAAGEPPSPLHHNCSGKHAGFLALALHMGVAPADYLDPESASQLAVRAAMRAMCDLGDGDFTIAIDGCSAPTYRMPLDKLATGLARVANPDDLADERRLACTRITAAAAAFPELIAGHHKRLCTDLARITGGRLFPKVGAEAVYVVGEVGGDRAYGLKVDDGSMATMDQIVVEHIFRLGFLTRNEYDELEAWHDKRLFNAAGLEVGTREVL